MHILSCSQFLLRNLSIAETEKELIFAFSRRHYKLEIPEIERKLESKRDTIKFGINGKFDGGRKMQKQR
jgi:hypothetical protein